MFDFPILPSIHRRRSLARKTLSKTSKLCREFGDSKRQIVAFPHSSAQHMKIPKRKQVLMKAHIKCDN
jgi:hypothetical protein